MTYFYLFFFSITLYEAGLQPFSTKDADEPECGDSLFNEEELQVHHLLARSQGGKNSYSNLALIHLLCHQHIHAKTERAMSDCRKYNDQELLTDESKTTRRSKREKQKEPCGS